MTAASGSVPNQVAVTGTAPAAGNVGTSLKVACVVQGGACPDVGAPGWVAVGTSGTAEQVAKLSDGSTDLVGGTTYTCYSIEVDANDSNINECSDPMDAIAALNAPTVSAETGLVGGAVSVTATAPLSSNQDSELKIACVADGGSCPAATGTTWISATTSGSPQQVSTLADGSSMVGGTAYTCYSAELSTTDGSYRACSDGTDVTSKLNAPSVSATSGSVPNQVAVTGTDPAAGNVGTTLKVACVDQDGVCPDVGAPGWVAVGTSGTAEQVAKLSDGSTDLVGGTTYTCYSIEVDANDSSINECSDPMDAIAALNAPTLASAAPGSSPAQIDITASSPTGLQANANTQLKVACVDQTQGCPDDTGPWVDVQIDGAAQAVSVLNAGQTYTCFAAEFSTIDTIYRVCSSLLGTDAVAAMNAPTLDSAAPGSSSGNIIVAATSPTNPANVDATLKYACVPYDGGAATCPDADAVGANGWSALGTITGLTAGDTYTCFAGEFSATASPIYRVCSSGGDATASPLNAPTVSATSGLVVGQVEVTAQGASPANINTELKVACAPYAGSVAPSCPSTGNTWQTYVTGPMQVLTDAAGSALVSGIRYSCFSAEFSDINSDIYSCSDPSDVIAAMNPPTVSAATGLVGGAVSVTATAPLSSNQDSELKIACVADGGSCPAATGTTWISATTSGSPQQVSTLADGSSMVGGTAYTCYSAELSTTDGSYRACSDGTDVTSKLNAPSVSATSGSVPNQVAVTGTNPAAGNVGTTLKVACVVQGGACPDVGAPGWVAVGTSGTAEQVAKLSDGSTDLVGGTTYTCYSIEVDANDSNINECSDPMDAIAALNAPTVSAETGLVGGAVSVTATAPLSSNQDSELKIACVADGGSCPAATGTTWISATTSGSPQQVSTLADGSSMVGGTAYTCYSAELSTTDGSYRACSDGTDVTSKLNAPSVSATSGSVPNQVAVTGTNPAAGNVGTTLKVSCVVQGGACPDVGAPGWVAVGTSGTAEQVAKLSDGSTDLVGGTTYTCYSIEVDANDSNINECSDPMDAIAAVERADRVCRDRFGRRRRVGDRHCPLVLQPGFRAEDCVRGRWWKLPRCHWHHVDLCSHQRLAAASQHAR